MQKALDPTNDNLEEEEEEEMDDKPDETSSTLPPRTVELTTVASGTISQEDRKGQLHRSRWIPIVRGYLLWLLLHLFTIAIYVVPIFLVPNPELMNGRSEEAVLDELHIINADNKDVNGPTTLRTIFTNDYWGRPLTFRASHKSWRPLTILSFRYLRGVDAVVSDLGMHRLVNILTHAAAAELVGILASRLFTPPTVSSSSSSSSITATSGHRTTTDWVRWLAKLCFALHPTHVEVVANAANRSHILSVLLTVYASDPTVPFLAFVVAVVAALVSSETALFQIVSAAATCTAIAYRQRHLYHHNQQQQQQPLDESLRPSRHWFLHLMTTMFQPNILSRLLFLAFSAVAYYGGRLYFDTLSIPVDLIRSAENPFFRLTGWTRVYSYAMVLAIHIGKQWDLDWIGFSHEYGHACVVPVHDWRDQRMWIPVLSIALAHLIFGIALLLIRPLRKQRESLSLGFLVYVIYWAWTVTLFPVSGLVKVGTFISDRIVVPSSVPIALIQAYAIAAWLNLGPPGNNEKSQHHLARRQRRYGWKVLSLLVVLVLATKRIYKRSREWMSSYTLLESSLRTCPRFGKAHAEMSKIYQGLDEKRTNLTLARWHLERAEESDPDFCDVHQQFAMIGAKEFNFDEFETRLAEALKCPFTNTGSMGMWQQYWQIQLDPQKQPPAVVDANKRRYNEYVEQLNKVVAIEQAKQEEKKKLAQKSPFAGFWGSREAT
jgi:hypothetical protein